MAFFIIPEQIVVYSQKDAVVIEGTINLAFVQQGNATLHLYPHFKSLQDLEGNNNYQKDWTIILLIVVIIFPSKSALGRKITPATKTVFKLIKLKPNLDIDNDLSLVPYDRDSGARRAKWA